MKRQCFFVRCRRTYVMSLKCRISFAKNTVSITKLHSGLNHSRVLVLDVPAIIFFNSRKDGWKDVETEFFLWDVEELTFLIIINWEKEVSISKYLFSIRVSLWNIFVFKLSVGRVVIQTNNKQVFALSAGGSGF